MHITAPRVLGFLMFLGLVGYTFFLGPWLNRSSAAEHAPTSSVAVSAPRVPSAASSHAPARGALAQSPLVRGLLSRAE